MWYLKYDTKDKKTQTDANNLIQSKQIYNKVIYLYAYRYPLTLIYYSNI